MMDTTVNPEDVLEMIDKHHGERGAIIAILEDIQASYNYLPETALKIVSKKTNHSLVDLYGVATFYSVFSLEPRGEHLVSVCMGTACHVRGAPAVLDKFEETLEVKAGQTTEDRSFTLNTVNCVGACALGPVAVTDGHYCSKVKKQEVPEIVDYCRCADLDANVGDPEEILRIAALCPHCNRSLMSSTPGFEDEPMINVTVTFGDKHGWMKLSSIWGEHKVYSEHEIPPKTLVNFFCPKCNAELRSPKLCPKCDAPTIPLLNKTGGIVTICSRHGCREHMFELS